MADPEDGRDDDSADEKLRKYRAKRSADRTPEPFGGEAVRPFRPTRSSRPRL